MLCEEAELYFIAGDVQERGLRLEDEAEDWMGELGEAGAGDVDERKRDGEEGDGELGLGLVEGVHWVSSRNSVELWARIYIPFINLAGVSI